MSTEDLKTSQMQDEDTLPTDTLTDIQSTDTDKASARTIASDMSTEGLKTSQMQDEDTLPTDTLIDIQSTDIDKASDMSTDGLKTSQAVIDVLTSTADDAQTSIENLSGQTEALVSEEMTSKNSYLTTTSSAFDSGNTTNDSIDNGKMYQKVKISRCLSKESAL